MYRSIRNGQQKLFPRQSGNTDLHFFLEYMTNSSMTSRLTMAGFCLVSIISKMPLQRV